jgi:hypothetical protein
VSGLAVLKPSVAGPYRYLDYFHEEDHLTFAGREEDIAEVAARASADEPFVLYGRSGLGKTSLLLAGVFPVLRDRNLHPIHIRTLDEPTRDLRTAIARAIDFPAGADAHDLNQLIARACVDGGGLVLVLDQFEEFFIHTRGQSSKRLAFIHLIAELVLRSHGDVRVTFSLREDYLAELDEFKDAFPNILTNQYRLHPLTAFGARQAIVAPLVAADIQFDQRLVVRLVDMLAEVGFDPVLLQVACGEVYREAMKRTGGSEASLTEADLDKVGGIDGLFERYLDNAIARVPKGQLLLCRAMLDALTTPEETKRAVTFDALLRNDAFQASPEEIQSVLDCLKAQKLLRPDLRGEQLFYELSHDRLAPSVVKWFKTDTDFSRFRDARDVIADSTRRASLPDRLETLIGKAQIAKLIAPYRERLRLSDAQRRLMFWSAAYSGTENLDFWAKLFGIERSIDALRQMFTHPSPDARLGAATAVEQLGNVVRDLSADCVATALHDDDAGVRRAAARALAPIARDTDILVLQTALGSSRTRSSALDVLATFVEVDGPIERFGRFWRLRAGRRARRRALAQHREAIASRAKRGALLAGTAAGLWSATVGVVLAALSSWARGELNWIVTVFIQVSLFAAAAAVLSVPVGWILGRIGATRAAAARAEGKWMSVTWRVGLVGAVVTLVLGALSNPSLLLSAEFALGGLLITFIVAGVIVRLFRSAVWPPARTPLTQRVIWALLLGLPVTGPLATLAFLGSNEFGDQWYMWGAFGIAPAIVALTLSESAVAFPIGAFPPPAPRMRLIMRFLLSLLAFSIPAIFVALAGMDSVPFLAKTYVIANDFQVPLPLSPGRADSVYFAIESNGTEPQWLRATTPDSVTVKSVSGDVLTGASDGHSELLYVPAGRSRLSATSRQGTNGNQALRFWTIPQLVNNNPMRLSEDVWSLYMLRLDEVPDADSPMLVWKADVRPRMEERTGGTVRVLMPGGGTGSAEIAQALPGQATAPQPVKHQVPIAFARLDFPVSTSANPGNYGELQAIPIEADATFWISLTYRLSAADVDAAAVAGQPLYIPVLLAVRGPDYAERLVESEAPGKLLARLKSDSALWGDAEELEQSAVRLSLAKRHDESITLRERIVQLIPDDAQAYNNLAWEMLIAKRGAKALEPARLAAMKSERKDANILDTLAHAEYESGNLKEAIQAWEETLTLEPTYYARPQDAYCLQDLKLLEDARRVLGVRPVPSSSPRGR